MPVPVTVRLGIGHRRIVGSMLMLVVLVVDVGVRMFQRFVRVLVRMSFGEMEPNAKRHTRRAGGEQDRGPFAPDNDRCRRADERREREVRSRARRPKVPKCEYVQHQTHAVTHESKHERRADDRNTGPARSDDRRDPDIRPTERFLDSQSVGLPRGCSAWSKQ